ncbi:MAG TPA: hypothetical protein PK048_01000 [Candidatus Absconditabacterales bacterium]|nr:hypothetical protein [Candidatus Absconditabacterales bacterium]
MNTKLQITQEAQITQEEIDLIKENSSQLESLGAGDFMINILLTSYQSEKSSDTIKSQIFDILKQVIRNDTVFMRLCLDEADRIYERDKERYFSIIKGLIDQEMDRILKIPMGTTGFCDFPILQEKADVQMMEKHNQSIKKYILDYTFSEELLTHIVQRNDSVIKTYINKTYFGNFLNTYHIHYSKNMFQRYDHPTSNVGDYINSKINEINLNFYAMLFIKLFPLREFTAGDTETTLFYKEIKENIIQINKTLCDIDNKYCNIERGGGISWLYDKNSSRTSYGKEGMILDKALSRCDHDFRINYYMTLAYNLSNDPKSDNSQKRNIYNCALTYIKENNIEDDKKDLVMNKIYELGYPKNLFISDYFDSFDYLNKNVDDLIVLKEAVIDSFFKDTERNFYRDQYEMLAYIQTHKELIKRCIDSVQGFDQYASLIEGLIDTCVSKSSKGNYKIDFAYCYDSIGKKEKSKTYLEKMLQSSYDGMLHNSNNCYIMKSILGQINQFFGSTEGFEHYEQLVAIHEGRFEDIVPISGQQEVTIQLFNLFKKMAPMNNNNKRTHQRKKQQTYAQYTDTN